MQKFKRTIIRVPQQERSTQRFEAVVSVTLRLLGERSDESISMREIAQEANMPIAQLKWVLYWMYEGALKQLNNESR